LQQPFISYFLYIYDDSLSHGVSQGSLLWARPCSPGKWRLIASDRVTLRSIH
jgi:hypothetical protein